MLCEVKSHSAAAVWCSICRTVCLPFFLCPPQTVMRWRCKTIHDNHHWSRFWIVSKGTRWVLKAVVALLAFDLKFPSIAAGDVICTYTYHCYKTCAPSSLCAFVAQFHERQIAWIQTFFCEHRIIQERACECPRTSLMFPYCILRKKKEERMEGGSTETTKPGIYAK